MFKKNIPTFKTFINESLFQSNWRNYTKDTDVNINKESNDIAQQLLRMFEVDSTDDLIFTSNDISFGNDFMFFLDIIMGGNASFEKQQSLSLPGYTVYLEKHIDGETDCPIVLVNVVCNDGTKYSHIFIKKDDFLKFDPDADEDEETENDSEEKDDNNSKESSSQSQNSQTQSQSSQTQGQEEQTQSQEGQIQS